MAKSSEKLSVAFLFDDTLDSNDGVAQYVKTLGAWLSGRGHRVEYLVGETKLDEWHGGQVHGLAKNLKVRFNGNRLSMPLSSKKNQLRKVLSDGDFDLLHVMTPYSPLMAGRLINLAAPGTAVVGTFHVLPSGWTSRLGSRLLRLLLRSSLKKFDGFASVSQPAQEFAQRFYGIKSEVIPNPVDIKKFQTKPSENKNQIVFLGRLVKRKGAGQLIEAFAKISESNPEYELIIAGDGPQRKSLENLAKRLNIQERVRFLGYIDEKIKPELLAGATIACFPSLYGESFGIVLIEAMAAGAGAVLAGDNPGYRSVLAGRPELLFNPKDTAFLASKLLEFLANDKRRREIHDWQNKEVTLYDIPVVGRKIEQLYERAIAKNRAGRHN